MASSENQGLQIALIILFILFILLSLSTFVFFKDYQEADSRAKKDAQAAIEKSQALTTTVDELNKLKQFIGLKADDDVKKVESTFTDDMNKYGASLPAEKKFYRDALEASFASLNSIQAQLTAAKDEITQLKAVNSAFEKTATEKVTASEDAKAKALADLEAERGKFMEAQKKSEEEKKQLVDQLAKVQQESAASVEKVKKDLEVVQKTVGAANERGDKLAGEVDRLSGKTFAGDDGEIRSVNQRLHTVWIGLGRADALRPQTTFTVHAPGQKPNDPNTKVKGKIEVTQILGDHMAEAKVLEDSLRDPILPGDKIYTPLWDPGRREHFAIAGSIDFDDDDKDDRERLRHLIELNGGVIDAELEADGNIKGHMSVNTSYLILGKQSGEKTRESYNSMLQTAKQFSIPVLSAQTFLDQIGWHNTSQLVRFGHDSNIQGVLPRELPDGGLRLSPGRTSELFRQRRPTGQGTSAY